MISKLILYRMFVTLAMSKYRSPPRLHLVAVKDKAIVELPVIDCKFFVLYNGVVRNSEDHAKVTVKSLHDLGYCGKPRTGCDNPLNVFRYNLIKSICLSTSRTFLQS
uniref:Uncharacterized protein n=1 Tax=Cucumis melo TaxID=3656 RepID=A0A9I9EBE4_CUCME